MNIVDASVLYFMNGVAMNIFKHIFGEYVQ